MTTARTIHPAAGFLAEHAWKDASVELDGEAHPVAFFDWYDLQEQDEEVIAEGHALPQDRRDHFFSGARLWITEFFEYFAGEAGEGPIEDKAWLPVAVLGMCEASTIDTFAESSNGGYLALVLGGDQAAPGSVIWCRADAEPVTVAASIAELKVQLEVDDD